MYLNFLSQDGRFVVRLEDDFHLHLGSSHFSNKRDDAEGEADVLCGAVSMKEQHVNENIYIVNGKGQISLKIMNTIQILLIKYLSISWFEGKCFDSTLRSRPTD